MKYINLKYAYLFENPEELLKIDIGENIEKVKVDFKMKDIVLLRGNILSKDGKIGKLLEKFVVADTDLNILSYIMNFNKHKSVYFTSFIRYEDIYPLYELIADNDIEILSENKIPFFSNEKKCLILVNIETGQRVFKYISYNKSKFNDIIKYYSDLGLKLALSLDEKEVITFYQKFHNFNKIEELFYGENLFVNYRLLLNQSSYLTKDEMKSIYDIRYIMSNLYRNVYKEIKDNNFMPTEERKRQLDKLENSLMVDAHFEMDAIKLYETEDKEKNPFDCFNRITLYRNNFSTYKNIFNILQRIEKTNKENIKKILKSNDFVNDILLKNV